MHIMMHNHSGFQGPFWKCWQISERFLVVLIISEKMGLVKAQRAEIENDG